MDKGITARLIAMAVSLVGDTVLVRNELGCTEQELIEYCNGRMQPSAERVDLLMALIVREQGKIIAENRDLKRNQADG